MTPDLPQIDRTVLALLWLTAFRQAKDAPWQAWKGHDWEALGRLHEAGWIEDPRNRNKSVTFTEAGAARAESLFRELSGASGPGEPAARAATREPFSPAGRRLWERIPAAARLRILNEVWCGHCGTGRPIIDFTGLPDERNDLVLRGFCAHCGHLVVRLLQTGELGPGPSAHHPGRS